MDQLLQYVSKPFQLITNIFTVCMCMLCVYMCVHACTRVCVCVCACVCTHAHTRGCVLCV